jgi:hypothetical protein
MFELMEAGFWKKSSGGMWPELVRGLMARSPSRMIAALRESGALQMCGLRSLACSVFPRSAAIRPHPNAPSRHVPG